MHAMCVASPAQAAARVAAVAVLARPLRRGRGLAEEHRPRQRPHAAVRRGPAPHGPSGEQDSLRRTIFEWA